MPRKATGEVIYRAGKDGGSWAIRFPAYGDRPYETLGKVKDGWTRSRAEEELQNVMADVRRGIWRPKEPDSPPEAKRDPSFHEFASEWVNGRRHALADRTIDDYRWALCNHLLPFFARYRLNEITAEVIDRYSRSKVRERAEGLVARPLSNNSINKTLTRLSQVLEEAVEYGYIERNPAQGKRRRLIGEEPRRASLTAEQVWAVLSAAGELDAEDRTRRRFRRPILATAILGGGERVSALMARRRRDLDLAAGTLSMDKTKTAAGQRQVDLSPYLRKELAAYVASTPLAPDDYLFPTRSGGRRERNNVRERILYPAIERANNRLGEAGRPTISPHVTFHSLRRTMATLLAEVNADPAYTASFIGHEDKHFTLKLYTDVHGRRDDPLARVDALVLSFESAQNGTNGGFAIPNGASPKDGATTESQSQSGILADKGP